VKQHAGQWRSSEGALTSGSAPFLPLRQQQTTVRFAGRDCRYKTQNSAAGVQSVFSESLGVRTDFFPNVLFLVSRPPPPS
jgi:hypothetical protein